MNKIHHFFHVRSSRWNAFWERMTEGLSLEDLWTQFRGEARASYDLYAREVDWSAGKEGRSADRPRRIVRDFFWAMMMKLSPAGRVFLLLALVLAVLGALRVRIAGLGGPGLMFFAILALLVLLALELAERVTMKRDLEVAREIQRWLVPDEPPAVPGLEIAFATRPANTVAGDYYDAFFRRPSDGGPPSGGLLLAVADVAGKSIPAGLLMATFQAGLRALAAEEISLAELVARLNRLTCANSLGGQRFTTAFLAEFDPSSRRLDYINAGHNAPVLRRHTGGVEHLEAAGPPLGVFAETEYEASTLTLAPGDRLVIFTDGVVEATNEADEEFGEQRLLETINSVDGQKAQEALNRLLAAVYAFAGTARQHDDITCMMVHTVSESATPEAR